MRRNVSHRDRNSSLDNVSIYCLRDFPLNERPELDFGLFSHPDHYLLAVAGSLFGLAYPRQMFFSLHRRFRKRGFTRTIAIADA